MTWYIFQNVLSILFPAFITGYLAAFIYSRIQRRNRIKNSSSHTSLLIKHGDRIMKKEEVIRRLEVITESIRNMDTEYFERGFKDEIFEINFNHACWGDPFKMETKIIMEKSPIE